VIDEVGEVEDGSNKPEQSGQAEKRPYKEESGEADNNIQPFTCCDRSRNTRVEEEEEKEDEEDEDLRHAKRWKRHSQLTRQNPAETEYGISQTSRSPSAIRESVPVRSIKSGPSKAFSNAQESETTQRTVSSSNYRVRQSALACQ
jgi:hypothetical protein